MFDGVASATGILFHSHSPPQLAGFIGEQPVANLLLPDGIGGGKQASAVSGHAAATPEEREDSCILVAGLYNGTLVAVDPNDPDRIRFRLGLFPQIYADMPIDGQQATHIVNNLQFEPEVDRLYASAAANNNAFIS